MAEPESQVHYRVAAMLHALHEAGRTRFASVLDVGCGDGAVLRRFVPYVEAESALGIDLDAPPSANGTITLRRADLFEFVAEEPFDLVVSNQVFEHINEPLIPSYFESLQASCAPGGTVLLSTPNRWRALNLARLATLRRPHMMNPNPGVPPEDHVGHHRECSYRELRTYLDRHFDPAAWDVRIVRSAPRVQGSRRQWLGRIAVYGLLWPIWRPAVVSASQDHYVVAQRRPTNNPA